MTTQIVKNAGKLGLAAVLLAALAVPACKQQDAKPDPGASGADATATGQTALDEGDWSRAYDSFRLTWPLRTDLISVPVRTIPAS